MPDAILKINPCHYCHDCLSLKGQECERATAYLEVLAAFEKLQKEIQITRDYIHYHNLEWDLLSYATRMEKEEDDEWMK